MTCAYIRRQGDFQYRRFAEPSQLQERVRTHQKVQEPLVPDLTREIEQPRTDRLEIGLERIQHTDPLVHQPPPSPRQSLQALIGCRHCAASLQHGFGQREMRPQAKQLEPLTSIQSISLGAPGKTWRFQVPRATGD